MMHKSLFWILLFISGNTVGQTYLMNGTPITTCSGTFYDGGGSAGNYANNQNLSTTICPDNNQHIRLDFKSIQLTPGDELCFLDGSSVLAPLLFCVSDLPPGQPFMVEATPANPGGCLTLTFVTDGAVNAPGWEAAVSCVSTCLFPAPTNVQVVEMSNGNMIWTWNDVPGSLGFEVSVNGGAWQPASGNLSHTVSGLNPGNLVVIEIRAIHNFPNCTTASITANQLYVDCALSGSIGNQLPALCPGTATGSVNVLANGAMGAVQFFIDANPNPFPTGIFANFFAAGNHSVILKDAAGCLDTVLFTITEPPALVVTDSSFTTRCFGTNSGRIKAMASGGSPPYNYAWQSCQGGPITPDSLAIDLFAGNYCVTVTDKNGCTVTLQDSIRNAPKYEFDSVQDSVTCFGGNDGHATVFVSGAAPPYTFKWTGGAVTQTADSLKAGTYSVTVTDSLQCKAVTLVEVLQPLQLVIDSLATVHPGCFGGATGSITVTAHGGVTAYTYQWNVPGNNKSLVNIGAGAYTVTVTDRNGCTAASSTMLNAPPELQLQIAGLQPEKCVDDCTGQFTLNIAGGVTPYSIDWNTPTIPPGTTNPANLCPDAYAVTVTDKNSCSKTINAVIQAAVPIALNLSAINPRCPGDQNGSLTAQANGGVMPFVYSWSTGAGGAIQPNLPCGVFTVTVTDSLGCIQVAADTLECPPSIVLDSIVAKPVRCFGESNGQITINAHGGTGVLTFSWSDPNQQFNPTAVDLPKGLYTVTVSDANGCTLAISDTVDEPPVLGASISVTPVTCFGGNNGSAAVTVTGGVEPYAYTWNIPQNTPVITGLTAGAYSLTITDAYGCPFIPAPAQIQSPATPVQVTVTQTQKACFGATNGQALATAGGSNGPPFTYAWSHGNSDPSPGNFSAGAYTVTATDTAGCTGAQTVNIQQWDSIFVNVVLIQPSCAGTPNGQAYVNLVNGGAGNGIFDNYHFQWSVPGLPDTVYINNLPGNQNYGLTITDNTGCTAEYTYLLEDQDSILVSLQTDSVSCAGLSDGAVTIASIQSKRPIVSYGWSDNSSAAALMDVPAGMYGVTVTDSEGCTGASSATVFEPAPLSVQLDIQALVCNSDSNGAIRALVQGGTPGYAYAWSNANIQEQITGLGPDMYTVTVTDQSGCTHSASHTLVQPNSPAIQVEVTEPACFGGKDGIAHLAVTGAATPYRYSLDGQTYTGSSVFLGLAAGQYLAYVLDGMGCVTNVAISIGQPPAVTASLGPGVSLTLGDSLLLTPDVFNAVGLTAYSWQSALVDSIRCVDPPDCSTVLVRPEFDNTYKVTVTDANNCRGETQIQVAVEKPRGVHIPTAFSPNGDAVNDLLVVYGKSRQIKQVNLFRLYDRWGELLYEDLLFAPNNEQRGWNGQFRGQDCQAGVYAWYVEVEYIDGYVEAKRGNTILIR